MPASAKQLHLAHQLIEPLLAVRGQALDCHRPQHGPRRQRVCPVHYAEAALAHLAGRRPPRRRCRQLGERDRHRGGHLHEAWLRWRPLGTGREPARRQSGRELLCLALLCLATLHLALLCLATLHLAPVEARGHTPISAATSGNLAANPPPGRRCAAVVPITARRRLRRRKINRKRVGTHRELGKGGRQDAKAVRRAAGARQSPPQRGQKSGRRAAADSRCAHHGASHSHGNQARTRKHVRCGGTLHRLKVSPWRAAAQTPWRPAAIRSPSAGDRRTAYAHDGARSHVPMTARGCPRGSQSVARSSLAAGVPGFTEEGDDLVLAIRPRVVEGRLAVLGSERRVGALLEKALDDREVAIACTAMKCCASVTLRHMGHVREKPRGHPRGKGFGGEGSRLTFVSLTFAWASRRISTQPSYPLAEDTMSAVFPYWGDASSEGGRLQQELAGGRRAQQARRGRVCKARRAGGAAAQPAPTRLAGVWRRKALCRRPLACRGKTTRAPTRGACGGAPQDCAS